MRLPSLSNSARLQIRPGTVKIAAFEYLHCIKSVHYRRKVRDRRGTRLAAAIGIG